MVTGGLGFGLFWRRLKRRPLHDAATDPALALRAKLDAQKTSAEAVDHAAPEAQEEPAVPDPASRRQAVHDRARSAIDELR